MFIKNKRNRLSLPLKSLLVGMMCGFVSMGAWAGGMTYTYDSLSRIIQAVYSNGVVIVYAYDKAGNRTSHIVSGAAN